MNGRLFYLSDLEPSSSPKIRTSKKSLLENYFKFPIDLKDTVYLLILFLSNQMLLIGTYFATFNFSEMFPNVINNNGFKADTTKLVLRVQKLLFYLFQQ